mgnify:CR=1 FL=1
MPRHNIIDNVQVPFTAQEEIDRDAEEAKELAEKPTQIWERDMASFTLSREMEEHIQIKHGGVADTPYQQAIYDAKVARRAEKP